MEMANSGEYGKIYGAVQGISSLLASVGGMISGLLYQFKEGEYALYICSFLLIASTLWAAIGLKNNQCMHGERLPILQIFKSINKRILIFCVLDFYPVLRSRAHVEFYHTHVLLQYTAFFLQLN